MTWIIWMLGVALAANPNSETTDALYAQIEQLYADGLFGAAEVAAREMVSLQREQFGHHAAVATALNDLALLVFSQGRYEEARPLFDESLAMWRDTLGPNHPDVAAGINNLAGMLLERGEYDDALALFEESLAIATETKGPLDPLTLWTMNNVAMALNAKGQLAEALEIQEESLSRSRQVLGNSHPQVARNLSNLGLLLSQAGDDIGARDVYEESLAIRREVLGPKHPDVATSLHNLSLLLGNLGDHERAAVLSEESLDIYRSAMGPEHILVASGLDSLGAAKRKQGDFVAAQAMFEEGLEIRRVALGPDHPDVAASLSHIGGLLVRLDEPDLETATLVYAEANDILVKALGPDHSLVAANLVSRGWVARRLGDPEQAREYYEAALASGSADSQGSARFANALSGYGDVLVDLGDIEGARASKNKALAIVDGRLTLLDSLSERAALNFVYEARDTLDSWLDTFDEPGDEDEAWTEVGKFKGAVSYRLALATALSSVDPQLAEIGAELTEVRRQIAQIAFAENTRYESDAAQIDELTERRIALERTLMERSAEFRSAQEAHDAGPQALCEALPANTALIDVIERYVAQETWYTAFGVLAGDCTVHRIELGPAEPINQVIENWRAVLTNPDELAQRVDERGRAVRVHVWDPLAPLIGDATRILMVPDGIMSEAPLGALPTDDDRYLMEDYSISYLDRAGDLLREVAPSGSGALVVGGVDYDAENTGHDSQRRRIAPCNGGGFGPLAGTEAEADAIVAKWKHTRHKQELIHLRGIAATEGAVTQGVTSPIAQK